MRGLSSTEWRNGGQDGASGSAPNPHVRKDLGRHLRLLGQQAVPIDDRRGHVHDVAVRGRSSRPGEGRARSSTRAPRARRPAVPSPSPRRRPRPRSRARSPRDPGRRRSARREPSDPYARSRSARADARFRGGSTRVPGGACPRSGPGCRPRSARRCPPRVGGDIYEHAQAERHDIGRDRQERFCKHRATIAVGVPPGILRTG